MFNVSQTVQDFITIVLTHECNKKCAFCIDQYRGEDLYISDADVGKAIEFARQLGVKDVLLVGGEPTLHPNVVSIAKRVKAAGFNVIMTTNYSKPDVVKALDGIVSSFNISYYQQKELPKQSDFVSDLTMSVLIHRKQLNTKVKLDAFIDKFGDDFYLKFSTLTIANEWTERMQKVDYLDDLDAESITLFNEIEGQIYRGTTIKRNDRLINDQADQSYKAHANGEIIKSWTRTELATA